MEAKEGKHDQILADFLEAIVANRGLIANEKSMAILMELLKNSTLPSEATTLIAAALLKNAKDHSEQPQSGRCIRGLFLLTQDDAKIDLFVLQKIHGAQGRILNKDVVADLQNLLAKADFTEEKLDEIGHALQANADKFPHHEAEFTAPDQIDVWAPKMRDFLKRIGFVDCTLSIEAIEFFHGRSHTPVPRRMVGGMISSLLIETFAIDQKLPLAERIMKLALMFAQPEDVDPIRSHVLCGFFGLIDEANPSLVDFLTTEILKTTKLTINQEAVWHMRRVVCESDLSVDQKKQLTDAIESRTGKPKSARCQNIKALLLSADLEDKSVVDFILAEISKCKERILSPSEFETFVTRLAAPGIPSAARLEFITKLMENADIS